VTLLQPLLDALGGAEPRSRTARLADDQPARPGDAHRLLPVRADRARGLVGVPPCGSAMLRGLAAGSGLAVVGSRGARAGELVTCLPFPWSTREEAEAWT
jgi:hypothetical protein